MPCLIMIWNVKSRCNMSSLPGTLGVAHSYNRVLSAYHDDVIKWKHFPRYWPFVRGIHRSPVNSPHTGQCAELWCFLWSTPDQTVEETIETPLFWDAIAHYDVIVMYCCKLCVPAHAPILHGPSITDRSTYQARGSPVTCYRGVKTIEITPYTSQTMCQAGGAAFAELRPPGRLTIAGWNLFSLQWRHHGRDGVSNHQFHDCLLSRLFGRRSEETSKIHVTGICTGNSPVSGEFPAQMTSNAENDSIWWHHHVRKHENIFAFPLFLCTEMATLVEIIPHGKQGCCLSWITNTTGIDVTKGTGSHGTDSRIMRHCFLS